jgi:hypothetical protein
MHWGAAPAASTIDLFRDADYLFFFLIFWTGDEFMAQDVSLCFFHDYLVSFTCV